MAERGKNGAAKLSLAYLREFFGWFAERDAISEAPTNRIRLNGSLKAHEHPVEHTPHRHPNEETLPGLPNALVGERTHFAAGQQHAKTDANHHAISLR